METPVGNPTVSLLPQPATPAPIEPMRGGSMGGGSENVSLLPQPATPAPIEPMRGGGPENSLLPQPAQPVPIEPMRGGGLSPILYLREMRLSDLGLRTDEDIDIFLKSSRTQLHKRDMIAYNIERKKTWKDITLPTKTENTRNIELPYTITMDSDTILYIFYVNDFKHYLQVERKIVTIIEQLIKKITRNEEMPMFIIVDNTKTADDFSDIYRSFIKFVVSKEDVTYSGKRYSIDNKDQHIYFLFDKSVSFHQIAWDSQKEKDAKSAFYYLEPDYFLIKFPSAGKDKSFVLFPGRKLPITFKSDYVALGTSDEIPNKIDITGEGRSKKSKMIRDLDTAKTYSIDIRKKRDFWNNHYLSIKFSDVEDEDEDEENTDSVNSGSLFNDEEREEPVANSNDAPAKPSRVFQLKDFKDTVTVDLGGNDYEIRKSTPTVEAEWKAGSFSADEAALFDTIGINTDFVASKEPEKQTLVAQRGEFLRTLVLKNCLSDANYLLSTECDFMRDFLQDLLTIRQKDRLRAATAFITSIDDFTVDMNQMKSAVIAAKQAEKDIVGIDSLVKGLLGAVRFKLRTKLPVLFSKVLYKVSAAAAAASSKPVAVAVSSSVIPSYGFTSASKVKQKKLVRKSVFTKLFSGLPRPRISSSQSKP